MCCCAPNTDTIGCHATNDAMAESVYGAYKYERFRNPGISQRRASGLAQTRIMKSFKVDDAVQHRAARKPEATQATANRKRNKPKNFGYYYTLPYTEQVALLEMVRVQRKSERELDHNDQEELDAFRAARRKSNSELELESLVKQFALALSFYDRYKVTRLLPPRVEAQRLMFLAFTHRSVGSALLLRWSGSCANSPQASCNWIGSVNKSR